jgi:hypothetical protein
MGYRISKAAVIRAVLRIENATKPRFGRETNRGFSR